MNVNETSTLPEDRFLEDALATDRQVNSKPFAAMEADLERLASCDRRRALAPQSGLDFASNDYLGLAASGDLDRAARAALERGVAIGSGGSRLLRGNTVEHEALEEEAARFFGSESALFFSSGYTANSALYSTLPQRGDLIVCDEWVHASVHEGLRLSRAEWRMARHNDIAAFEDVISKWRRGGGSGQIWIAIESLYSMDGDFAPLDRLGELARSTGAVLLIDEAHATGIFGPSGRGLSATLDADVARITLHTCGKAIGCEGALLCCPKTVREFMVNRARAFIFSTAPSPLIAATVRAALGIIAAADARREELHRRIALAQKHLSKLGVIGSGSPIFPLILGADGHTMMVASQLQKSGFDIRGIRPPTVPEGTSRLRIVVTLNSDAQDIERLAEEIAKVLV